MREIASPAVPWTLAPNSPMSNELLGVVIATSGAVRSIANGGATPATAELPARSIALAKAPTASPSVATSTSRTAFAGAPASSSPPQLARPETASEHE
jgi:hypothetical protein